MPTIFPTEYADLLDDATPSTLILTTLRRDGMPVLAPVWFVAAGEGVWKRKVFEREAQSGRCSWSVLCYGSCFALCAFRFCGDPAVDIAALSCSGEPFLALGAPAYPGIATLLLRARRYRATFALQQAR